MILTRLLAFRNFAGLPFPASATPNQWAAAAERAMDWSARAGFPASFQLSGFPPRVIRFLREREILPGRFVPAPGKQDFKRVAVAPGGASWILINEVEHMTLGRLLAGSPPAAEANFPDPDSYTGTASGPMSGTGPADGWARSPRYGFLASDPGRIGPGVAIEQLVHLPGLALARELPAARNYCVAAGLGFAPAMPLPGSSASPADSGIFRISARGRLGLPPQAAYAGYLDALAPVLRREMEMRKACLARHPERLAERVRGSLERLAEAPSLSFPELLAAGSFARLGAALGLARPEIGKILESLRVTAASGHLGVSSERELTQEEEDFSRANVVRLSLGNQRVEGI